MSVTTLLQPEEKITIISISVGICAVAACIIVATIGYFATRPVVCSGSHNQVTIEITKYAEPDIKGSYPCTDIHFVLKNNEP